MQTHGYVTDWRPNGGPWWVKFSSSIQGGGTQFLKVTTTVVCGLDSLMPTWCIKSSKLEKFGFRPYSGSPYMQVELNSLVPRRKTSLSEHLCVMIFTASKLHEKENTTNTYWARLQEQGWLNSSSKKRSSTLGFGEGERRQKRWTKKKFCWTLLYIEID